MSGLLQEIWLPQIAKVLFQNNQFLNYAVDHSAFTYGQTVHIPQQASYVTTGKNPTSFPLTATQGSNTDMTYSMDYYYTSPIQITDLEKIQMSFPVLEAVTYNMLGTLDQTIGNDIINKWSMQSATNAVRTTGGSTADSSGTALAPGATGTRLAFSVADLTKAAAVLDKQFVPRDRRIALMPSDMYWQLINRSEVQKASYFGSPTLPSGIVDRIAGFDIMIRPTVAVYATGASGVIKSATAGTATTDNYGVLCYHPDLVALAKGMTKVFYQPNNPLYLGDVINAATIIGGTTLRADGKGYVNIVQA